MSRVFNIIRSIDFVRKVLAGSVEGSRAAGADWLVSSAAAAAATVIGLVLCRAIGDFVKLTVKFVLLWNTLNAFLDWSFYIFQKSRSRFFSPRS